MCQLLLSGVANALSSVSSQQPPQGFSGPSSRCREGTGCLSLLYSRKMFRNTPNSIPHGGHGAHRVRRQHGWRTLTPGHPCPLQGPLGMAVKPQRGDREKQQGMSEVKGKMSNPTHGMSPSSLKRVCCGHGVSGDCLDPIAKTFIACLGHL